MSKKMIGVVGGLGSYAGIDLIKKIYDLTPDVKNDLDHLPISMVSIPTQVADRNEFLLGKSPNNPAVGIISIIKKLVSNGANIIGIPCNTAHAFPILNVIKENIPESCKIVNMIDEVGIFILKKHPAIKKVGILGSVGTLTSNVYTDTLKNYGIEVVKPSEEIQKKHVNPSIYDQEYGIKSFSNPVTLKAKENLEIAGNYLVKNGAQAVILGCTEIPLAIDSQYIEDALVIDATQILAKALICESIQQK